MSQALMYASIDPFEDPQAAASFNSFEGVPMPSETVASTGVFGVEGKFYDWFTKAGNFVPGLALAFTLALLGKFLSQWVGVDLLAFSKSPISPILFVVVIGIIIRNTVGVPTVYQDGLRWSLKSLLRIGIALLGIRLSLAAVGSIGVTALPIVVVCIGFGIWIVGRINNALGLPRRLGTLIGVGTGICGVSAIVATAPTLDAEEDEVGYAVACVTIFGMIALFVYPFLAHHLFDGDPRLIGLFLGTSIHDTAQVAGAGLLYQQQFEAPEALNAATVTKLVRNLCLIGVIPLAAYIYHRKAEKQKSGSLKKWYQMIPLFVVGFVVMAGFRTMGDLGDNGKWFGLMTTETWNQIIAYLKSGAEWCLILAMAAVGLGVGFKKLRNLGFKPFLVGLSAAVMVGVISFLLIQVSVQLFES